MFFLFQKAQNPPSQIKTVKCVLTEYCRFVYKLKTAKRGDGGEVCCGGAGNGDGGFGDGGGGSNERL